MRQAPRRSVMGQLSFYRQIEREPIFFPAEVDTNIFATEPFEPRRGTPAKVSLKIVAINNRHATVN